MDFYDRLNAICKSKGTSISAVLRKCGLSKSYGTYWKKGAFPTLDVAIALSNILKVSLDTLAGNQLEIIEPITNENVYKIPVYESVSAGFGVTACSDVVEYVPVCINNKSDVLDTLCLKVKGDSMYPKIEDGDTIVVRKQPSVDSGEIAVIIIDNEDGVVKKIEYGYGYVNLISINPMYPPRRFEGEDISRLSIFGVVKQIIRNL